MKTFKLKIIKTETVETYILGKSKKEVKSLISKTITTLLNEKKDPITFFGGDKNRYYSIKVEKDKKANV